MSEIGAFRSYLLQWWRAAWAPAWDSFGWLGLAIAFVFWAWRKVWPENFQWSAAHVGLTPDAVMSDYVWFVPLAFGIGVLGYRLLRAPYEIHLASERTSADMLATANARIAELEGVREFNVTINHGGYYAVRDNDEDRGVWVIAHDVVITNLSDKAVPLALWLFMAPPSDSYRHGSSVQTDVPSWAQHELVDLALPGVVNVPGLAAVRGFCATNFDQQAFHLIASGDTDVVAKQLPVWLEVVNLLTDERKSHSLNFIARNLDRAKQP